MAGPSFGFLSLPVSQGYIIGEGGGAFTPPPPLLSPLGIFLNETPDYNMEDSHVFATGIFLTPTTSSLCKQEACRME